jgi:poly(A) polymerase
MIKQFIDKLIDSATGRKRTKPRFGKRVEHGPEAHRIDPAAVDERAQSVVRTLREAGFEAYIVGGAVRDLILGLRPKDFDVATNATPEQVKQLFRRAFIIGRRFRIVHVVFGRGREHEVIEVSTFRAYMDNAAAEAVAGNERTSRHELAGMTHAVDASGRVLRDNVWGPQDEDATRRDFSVNALYYQPETQVVVDFHGGLADAHKRVLRIIGDAATRYREDPVRIIRAVRFAAKLSPLGFSFDPKTVKPLVACQPLLRDVPQSRLFDEMLKLLQTGHALASIAQLKALGLAQGIYPLLDVVVQRAEDPLVKAALLDTDRRVGEGKPVAPSFLLACVLWSDVREGWERGLRQGEHPVPALQLAIDRAFDERVGDVSGRGKLGADMREIWLMQPRFERRMGRGPFGLVEQPRFRAGFDFMRLRAEVGELDITLADWWQEFSLADDAVREDLVRQVRESAAPPRRIPGGRGPRPMHGPGANPAEARQAPPVGEQGIGGRIDGNPDDEFSPPDELSPRPKRRRRRRKSNDRGGAAPSASGSDGV